MEGMVPKNEPVVAAHGRIFFPPTERCVSREHSETCSVIWPAPSQVGDSGVMSGVGLRVDSQIRKSRRQEEIDK